MPLTNNVFEVPPPITEAIRGIGGDQLWTICVIMLPVAFACRALWKRCEEVTKDSAELPKLMEDKLWLDTQVSIQADTCKQFSTHIKSVTSKANAPSVIDLQLRMTAERGATLLEQEAIRLYRRGKQLLHWHRGLRNIKCLLLTAFIQFTFALYFAFIAGNGKPLAFIFIFPYLAFPFVPVAAAYVVGKELIELTADLKPMNGPSVSGNASLSAR